MEAVVIPIALVGVGICISGVVVALKDIRDVLREILIEMKKGL